MRRLLSLVLGVCLLGAGCSAADGGPADTERSPVERDAFAPLGEDAAAALWRDTAKLRNRLLPQVLEEPFDGEALEQMSDGPLLAVQEWQSAEARAGVDFDIRRQSAAAVAVYGGQVKGDDQWVATSGRTTLSDPREELFEVRVFTRSSSEEPWRAAAQLGVRDSSAVPLPSREDRPPAESAAEATAQITRELIRFFEKGRAPDSVSVSEDLRDAIDGQATLGDDPDIGNARFAASEWSEPWIFAAQGSDLAVIPLRIEVTLTARPGRVIFWNGGVHVAEYGSAQRERLRLSYAYVALVRLPDDANPVGLLYSDTLDEVRVPARGAAA